MREFEKKTVMKIAELVSQGVVVSPSLMVSNTCTVIIVIIHVAHMYSYNQGCIVKELN